MCIFTVFLLISKEIHCRGESARTKHKLGFGRPDAEGQCLGNDESMQLFSERMRSCKNGW